MLAEGWYRDPFGKHDDRWFSAGRPTKLVRDGGVESHDPPPEPEWSGPLDDVPEPEPAPAEQPGRSTPGLDGSGAMGIGFS